MFKTMTRCIKGGQIPSDADLSKVPSFMFCKWLSGSRNMIHMSAVFNNHPLIPIRSQFIAIKAQFDGKISFVPFPKKHQVDMTKRIEVIQEMVQLNYEKAIDYLEYIDEAEYIHLEKEFDLRKSR